MKKRTNAITLVIVLVLIVAAIAYFESTTNKPQGNAGNSDIIIENVSSSHGNSGGYPTAQDLARIEEKSKKYERAKELVSPDGYINTDDKNITISEYIGKKVILVDFWTYSCINCQRTTPYLNSWYSNYKDDGLLIIGVHTPEFEFEKDYDNVLAAVKREGIMYPVVLDNEYRTWTAYNNRYWPRKYLIDIDGFIVYDHIGEGAYDETEQKIQEALAERAQVLGIKEDMNMSISSPSDVVNVDFSKVNSPETYFGSAKNTLFANGMQGKTGTQTLKFPPVIEKNKLYLQGTWDIQDQYAENMGYASIVYRYDAKNVYFVASAISPVMINISVDKLPEMSITVSDNMLYTVVPGNDYREHTLEIDIPQKGLMAYTFTFG